MQVRGLMASHVVWLTRIYKEIRLRSVLNALFDECESVLWNYDWIVKANDNLKFAFEVFGFWQEA